MSRKQNLAMPPRLSSSAGYGYFFKDLFPLFQLDQGLEGVLRDAAWIDL